MHGHEVESNQQLFQLGQIAHVDGQGGVNLALLEFLERQGHLLSSTERAMKRRYQQQMRFIGKYCLVLERLEKDYLVCYMTTFQKAVSATSLSPLARFFSFAIGDTPPHPSDTPPLHVQPGWSGFAYVHGVPVVRSNLTEVHHGLYTVCLEERDRLRSLIDQRIKASLTYWRKGANVDSVF